MKYEIFINSLFRLPMSKATKLYEEYIDNLVYVAAYNADKEQGLAQRACPNISNKELKR